LLQSQHQNANRNSNTRFFRGRTIGDIQRQISRDTYLQRKYSNPKYVKRIIQAYRNLMDIYPKGISSDGKMNHVMRHGLPSKDEQYVIAQYEKLIRFIKTHKNDKPNSATRKLVSKLQFVVDRTKSKYHISKSKRYNLRVPETIKQEPKVLNGQRIHIPLKEVL